MATKDMKQALIAKLASPEIFKQTIDAMKDLVKDANFDCNKSGIQVQTMDSSNVGMVHLIMNESAFEDFHCEEELTVGLNMESLHKVFRLCGPNDKVTITVYRMNEEGGKVDNKVYFTFESTAEDRLAKFAMKTSEIDLEPTAVPDPTDALKVTLPTGELRKAISELKEFGDSLTIQTNADGVTLGSGGDIGDGNVLLRARKGGKAEDSLTLEGNVETNFDMKFGMRYMNLFTRATALSKACTFQLAQGEPFRLKYFLEEESHGYLEFLLAPKLDD